MKDLQIIYQVDAFTAEAFKGNPAAVCILEKEPQKEWMQNIAMEMNLSETAFVFPGKDCRNIRFHSPEAEIPLCGHATLSASHILYETGFVPLEKEIKFLSKAGELIIRSEGSWVTMNFPAYGLDRIEIPDNLERIIGIRPSELHKTAHGWTFVFLKNESEVRDLKPDFKLMKKSGFGDMIVTAVSEDKNYDFCVRCFAPALGIDEDPVTGSAHTTLTPYWSKRLGKKSLTAVQLSARKGFLNCKINGDRVEISGSCRLYLKGEIYI